MEMATAEHMLSVVISGGAEELTRVAGLFRRRELPVASMAAGEASRAGCTKVTVVVRGGPAAARRALCQVRRLGGTVAARLLEPENAVTMELGLFKVRAGPQRDEALGVARMYGAAAIDETDGAIIFALAGSAAQLAEFSARLKPLGLMETVRTGAAGMVKGKNKTDCLEEIENIEEEENDVQCEADNR